MKTHIVAIIQARMSSSRLPGKVMLPLRGIPLLLHVVNRTRRARTVDQVVIATSTDRSDDIIEYLCERSGVDCFRGSLDNVLDRYVQAAIRFGATHVVRITSDCPLIDAVLIDPVVEALNESADYACNFLPKTLPLGSAVEVVPLAILEQVSRLELLSHHKEHVTPFIYENPGRFTIVNVECSDPRLRHPEWRWCVDECADYRFVECVYDSLFPTNPNFTSLDVAQLIESNPDLATINSDVRQKHFTEAASPQ